MVTILGQIKAYTISLQAVYYVVYINMPMR